MVKGCLFLAVFGSQITEYVVAKSRKAPACLPWKACCTKLLVGIYQLILK